jgi:hypothetical protein
MAAAIGMEAVAGAARAGVGADGAGAAWWGLCVNIYVIPRRFWSPRWGWVPCRYGYYPWGY